MAVIGAVAGFRDVREWYTRIAMLERQVCRVESPRSMSTGFLIAPDIVMMSHHSVDSTLRFRFDYSRAPETGELFEGVIFNQAEKDSIIAASPALDTALIRLEEPVGRLRREDDTIPRGWVDLSVANYDPPVGTAIAILQHPQGGPLKVAMSTNSVVRLDIENNKLFYRTDTAPGASGAPAFDIDWRFAAMHIGHDFARDNLNWGVPIAAISRWLKEEGLWAKLSEKPPMWGTSIISRSTPGDSSFGLEDQLKKLIFTEGESQRLELKERASKSSDEKIKTKSQVKSKISERVVCSIAAFLNSRAGGSVIIGISNDKKFIGIEAEYELVNKQRHDWDSYAIWLRDSIMSALEARLAFNYFSIVKYRESEKDICAIHVQPSDSPVFVNGVFYIRIGGGNKELRGHELLAYVAERWSWLGSKPSEANTMPILSEKYAQLDLTEN